MVNPTNYLGNVLKWEGKQLISYTPASNGSGKVTPYTYAYDESGIRTRKEVGNTTSEYYYCGELLMGIVSTTRNTDGSTSSITQRFSYDANGTVVALNYNGTYYYYIRNAVGDIVGLIDKTGTTVVSYTYDSWGKLLSTTGSKASTLGANQPFRYRGYVYDNETGWYYLQSRYYNPKIGRFISADVYLSTGQGVLGHNAYAYCGNNPATRTDSTGYSWMDAVRDGLEWVGDQFKTAYDYVTNTDEQVVLNADYFAFYKGVLVVKLPIGYDAFSFGIIFMGDEVNDVQDVKHEYGHSVHFGQIGVLNYILTVAIPSVVGNRVIDIEYSEYYSQPWEYVADKLGGVKREYQGKTYIYAPYADTVGKIYCFITLLLP